MQVFVLGMHRSGTSALARVLNLMGCYFGAEGAATDTNEENAKGFWERRDVRRINDSMLRSAGFDWDRVADFDPAALQAHAEAHADAVREVVLNLDAHRPWFVKEPRLCLLFPLWREALETPVCIHIHRHPLEVARSLEVRQGMPVEAGLALWEAYGSLATRASVGLPRVVVSYGELMREPVAVVARLADALSGFGYPLRQPGAEELAGFLDTDLHRQHAGEADWEDVATPSQRRMFDMLTQAEAEGIDEGWTLPELADESREALRRYENDTESVTHRRRLANQVAMRRDAGGDARELSLTRLELEQVHHDLRRARTDAEGLLSERNRLSVANASISEKHAAALRRSRELEEELGEATKRIRDHGREIAGLETTLRAKDLELVLTHRRQSGLKDELERAARDLEHAARQEEGFEQTLAEKDRELLDVFDELRRRQRVDARNRRLAADRRRLTSELIQRDSRAAEYLGLLDAIADDVEVVLSSKRWRLGDALLSLPHRLLRRKLPPSVAERLLALSRVRPGAPAKRHAAAASGRPAAKAAADADPSANARRSEESRAVARRPKRSVTVAVIAWDVGHNPLGRAYLVAEALARSYTVVLLGFQFPRYGEAVWAPLRHAPFRTLPIPGSDFPDFEGSLERLAARIDADVIVACKARLPSVQLGLMLKAFRNRPLIVDVDDYELSFFGNREPLAATEDVPAEELVHPFEEAWTRYTENLLPFADRLLVSNPALGGKFDGALVPHARDETVFDPERVDAAAARERLGVADDDRVVMFVGTPRPHKGIMEILEAVLSLARPDYRFVVVGTPPDKAFEEALRETGGDTLRLIPDQPFDDLPMWLAGADLVCLLQDPASEISRYQLPAKVVDAMAMGIPVLATAVEPLARLIEDEVIEAVRPDNLAERIDYWLGAGPETRRAHAERSRARFLSEFSYDAIHRTLVDEVERCLDEPVPVADEVRAFLGLQRRRYPWPRPAPASGDLDIVMFWKQGDTGLYGRRFDMLVAQLARQQGVRRVAVFDAPFSAHEAWRQTAMEESLDHHRLVAYGKFARRWGLEDAGRVSHHVFLFDNRTPEGRGRYPRLSAFGDFVADELERIGIEPREAIFWYYPVLDQIPEINRRFEPRLKVVDVVDDLRTWPDRTADDRAAITAHYREVLASADVALANCEPVAESMAGFGPPIAVVPNGCDLDPPPPAPTDARFLRFSQLEGPILGLVGNLESKTDLELLDRLARERPDHQIVLIGSAHTGTDVLSLGRHANVHFFGVVTYPAVKAWIERFDVALVPHLDSEQTRSMHPLKVLVYAAAGVPIVSTEVANLGEFEPFIHVGEDHDAFIEHVDRIVGGKVELDRRALAEAVERNSWQVRVDDIMGRVLEALG